MVIWQAAELGPFTNRYNEETKSKYIHMPFRLEKDKAMEHLMIDHAKVLVIDDEQGVRRFLRTSLSAHGYQIAEAKTGEEGILAAINVQPDIIILDLGLPDM